jgi:hypothetical protein
MGPERRRYPRTVVDGEGPSGVVKGVVAFSLRDISAGGLRLNLPLALRPGAVYPLTALLPGLSLTTPIRVTRCRLDGAEPAGGGEPAWEAGAEFLFRDDGDAAAVRRWLERRAPDVS